MILISVLKFRVCAPHVKSEQDYFECTLNMFGLFLCRCARLWSSIRDSVYAWLATAPLYVSLHVVEGKERRDVVSRTRGNVFLFLSRPAFSNRRYFTEEFNEELSHNLPLRPSGFSIWTYIFKNFYHSLLH